MKTYYPIPRKRQAGSALVITMVMIGVALAILASTMAWSSASTRLTFRSIQYNRSVAAAEAATEKVVSRISKDYLYGGDKQVADNLANYRQTVPTAIDSGYWGDWEFNDTATAGRTAVLVGTSTNFVLTDTAYSGLRAFALTYQIASHARMTSIDQNVIGGVLQEVHLARIPIFQFAMYSSSDMEISCGQPFAVTGRVHSNGKLYVEPDNALTFQSDVTAVKDILFARHPADSRGKPAGSVVYQEDPVTPVPALTLPIGTTNSPQAIREIINPPGAESADSPLGRQRYFNQADMLIIVTNGGFYATSGRFNNFAIGVQPVELAAVVTLTNSFTDARESKVVRPIDINIGAFTEWSRTNTIIRPVLASNDIASVYVWDRRTLPGNQLGAVRVRNGQVLPTRGLTVATSRPLYVQGHYNVTGTTGTTNTTTTRPASLVGDAVTVLSGNWNDANSTAAVGSRNAQPTTINAAFLTGVVETFNGTYSGGMENFPRFLETWGASNPFTYNGSMVKMFPSLYATNVWGKSDVYGPPKRNWAYDLNFNDPNKLPPLTPGLLTVLRGKWVTLAPDKNYASATP